MMKTNYQIILDNTLAEIRKSGKTPSLVLHSCCGPCSSYVLEYLTEYFDITVFYYNPNIYPEEEYYKRAATQKQLIDAMPFKNKVELIVPELDASEYYSAVKGLEKEREGGLRCSACFDLRLSKTAEKAKKLGADYFCTTLTVSPHKNSQIINAIAGKISEKTGVPYLFSDFKKKEGYKRSIELSKQYGLYRQDWCGCIFAKEYEI